MAHTLWSVLHSESEQIHLVAGRHEAPLPMAKVMRKEARHTQRRDRASGVPLEILEHLPPNQSAYFLLCALTHTSDFTGGAVPHYLSLKKELAYSSS